MMKSVGEKLRQLRTAKGLSQSDLAEKLYFSNRTISNWENNLRGISLENLKRIADFFEVPTAYFMDTGVDMKKTAENGIEKKPFKQIEQKVLKLKHRYYYFVFFLISLQIILGFLTFENRTFLTAIFLLLWGFFTIISIVQFFLRDKQNSRYYLVEEHKQIRYKTEVSPRLRKSFYFFELSTHIALVIIEAIFYSSSLVLYAFLNSLEVNALFTLGFSISFFIHVASIIRLILNPLYGEYLPYTQSRKYHGVMLLRALVTLHYGVFGYHGLSLFFYGTHTFPSQLIVFNLIIMFLLMLTLRMLLKKAASFFSTYQLDIQ